MAAKQYAKHKDVPKKYTWDLEKILEGKTYEYWFKIWVKGNNDLIKVKDSKYDSSADYLKALKKADKVEYAENKIFNYVSNSLNQDISSAKFKKINDELEYTAFELQTKLGSELNRMFKNAKKLEKWLKQPEFKSYKKDIQGVLDQKKHKLSDAVEEYVTKSARADISAATTFEILTDSELDYGYAVSSTGKKTKITDANRIKLLKSKDEKTRKSTMINYRKGFLNHKQSLANLLFQHFKQTAVMAKVRNFDYSVASVISADKADEKLLETLYSSVKENMGSIKRFEKARRQFFKIRYGKNEEKWDYSLPLATVKSEYTPEEGQQLVLKALAPMGKEYKDKVQEAFKNRWVDYMTVKNKRSGAYSIGSSYGLDNKYILMNWDGELRSVETLAHEMGHSMHSFYSDTTQPQSLSAYPIFLAEIASIFNELMLTEHLLKTTDNDKLKIELLNAAINGFNGSIIRQTMWSNYEFNLLKAVEEGQPLSSYEAISKLYFDATKDYSLKAKPKYKEEDAWHSIMVPHYYYGFYVYKYAIGYTVATVFFQRYKKEGKVALQNYIDKFLSAGGRDWPIQILKDAGIDLYDKNIYKEAFNQLDYFVDEYIKVGKRLFKK